MASGRRGLVTLHGFTGSAASWKRVTDPVADELGPVWHLSLIGHSRSLPRGTVSSFAEEADRIAAEILRHSDQPVVLAGYSLGARVALVTALHHPDLLAHLVLVSGRPGLGSDAERTARRAADGRWMRLLEKQGIEAFVEQWQAQPLWTSQASLPRELLEAQRTDRLRHDPDGLAASLEVLGLAQMPSCWSDLAALALPVELVVGELDEKFREIAESMQTALPDARLREVAGSGHNVLLERPEPLGGILIEVATVR